MKLVEVRLTWARDSSSSPGHRRALAKLDPTSNSRGRSFAPGPPPPSLEKKLRPDPLTSASACAVRLARVYAALRKPRLSSRSLSRCFSRCPCAATSCASGGLSPPLSPALHAPARLPNERRHACEDQRGGLCKVKPQIDPDRLGLLL